MNNEIICFNGNKYKGRWVHLPGLGEQLISSEKLNKELMGGDDKYVSTEAEVVDSTVYCYVPGQ